MIKKVQTPLKQKAARRIIQPGSDLTPAEQNILRFISLEMTSREIAAELELSVKTVENHRGNICKRLGITGTSALLKYALKQRQSAGAAGAQEITTKYL
jgi:DNA-binding CsgD family transcriptional regulator